MLSRWSLYCRFIARKCRNPALDDTGGTKSAPLSIPPVITGSNLEIRVDTRLATPFEIMTTFFFRRSVEKAFQLDEYPFDLHLHPVKPLSNTNTPYITSAVDDVMYILNKLLKRASSTCLRPLVMKIIASCRRILESDFIGMIQRKLRDGRTYIAVNPPPDDKIISFCILMNNLDMASEYTQRVIDGLVNPSETTGGEDQLNKLPDLFPFDNDAEVVESAFNGLTSSFEIRTNELLNEGISTLFSHVIRPRIRLIISESFKDAEYVVSESTSATLQDSDEESTQSESVTTRFTNQYHHLTHPFRRIMTPATYDKLLFTLAGRLSRLLEQRIWASAGRINELGAIRLERDITGIIGVVVREGKYGLRDMFIRCIQICMVLNMEEDEVSDMLHKDSDAEIGDGDDADGEVDWKLTKEERRRARSLLRMD